MNKSIAFGITSLILTILLAAIPGEGFTDTFVIYYALGVLIGSFGIAGVIALLVAGVYWVFKRKRMQNLSTTVWVLCIILFILPLL